MFLAAHVAQLLAYRLKKLAVLTGESGCFAGRARQHGHAQLPMQAVSGLLLLLLLLHCRRAATESCTLLPAGAKLDVATMQRRGAAGSYRMRQTALRRMHGKESLWGPLQLMLGR